MKGSPAACSTRFLHHPMCQRQCLEHRVTKQVRGACAELQGAAPAVPGACVVQEHQQVHPVQHVVTMLSHGVGYRCVYHCLNIWSIDMRFVFALRMGWIGLEERGGGAGGSRTSPGYPVLL